MILGPLLALNVFLMRGDFLCSFVFVVTRTKLSQPAKPIMYEVRVDTKTLWLSQTIVIMSILFSLEVSKIR